MHFWSLFRKLTSCSTSLSGQWNWCMQTAREIMSPHTIGHACNFISLRPTSLSKTRSFPPLKANKNTHWPSKLMVATLVYLLSPALSVTALKSTVTASFVGVVRTLWGEEETTKNPSLTASLQGERFYGSDGNTNCDRNVFCSWI